MKAFFQSIWHFKFLLVYVSEFYIITDFDKEFVTLVLDHFPIITFFSTGYTNKMSSL
jgi:hypothetical protein